MNNLFDLFAKSFEVENSNNKFAVEVWDKEENFLIEVKVFNYEKYVKYLLTVDTTKVDVKPLGMYSYKLFIDKKEQDIRICQNTFKNVNSKKELISTINNKINKWKDILDKLEKEDVQVRLANFKVGEEKVFPID